MFTEKNRICDPPEPPERRISPGFDVTIKSGAFATLDVYKFF